MPANLVAGVRWALDTHSTLAKEFYLAKGLKQKSVTRSAGQLSESSRGPLNALPQAEAVACAESPSCGTTCSKTEFSIQRSFARCLASWEWMEACSSALSFVPRLAWRCFTFHKFNEWCMMYSGDYTTSTSDSLEVHKCYCHLMNWFRKPACKFFPNIDDHGSCLKNELPECTWNLFVLVWLASLHSNCPLQECPSSATLHDGPRSQSLDL